MLRRAVDRTRRHVDRLGGLEMRAQLDTKRPGTRQHSLAIALEPIDIEKEAWRFEPFEALRGHARDRCGRGHHTRSSSG